MVIEVQLSFTDQFGDGTTEPLEFTHTLTAPDGFEITGGQLFVERGGGGELDRFSFRIDRNAETGQAQLTILEDVTSGT